MRRADDDRRGALVGLDMRTSTLPVARDEAGGTRANERPSRREDRGRNFRNDGSKFFADSRQGETGRKDNGQTGEGDDVPRSDRDDDVDNRPTCLSCFSCGVLSARWERVGASECACLHRLLHRPLAHSHDTLPAQPSPFLMRHSQLLPRRREGR